MVFVRMMSVPAFFIAFFLMLLAGEGLAQTTTAPPIPLTSLYCNFENETDPICGFTQDQNDDFDWQRHAGSTATENTGPTVDHTTGTEEGHYIYTESSHPQQHNDVANLVSPVLASTTTTKCFTFYFQLNGEDVGTLKVLLRPVNGSDSLQLKDLTGDHGNMWQKASITIQPQNTVFQILLESTVGESYRGDIAIDDVLLEDNACPLDNLFCNFEDRQLCGFRQDRTDDFDFTWISGKTRTRGTGPEKDHTYKNESGHYVFMQARRKQEGHQTRLISPMLAAHGGKPKCLIFYYHMYGNLMGDLNVYIKNSTSDSLGDPVWSIWGNRGNRWRAAEVEITTPHDYQVIFEAERGESWRGDIAIDDANVTFAPCPGHYLFRNESSVSCDFEESEICHYTQDKDDQFDWTWANRGTWWRFTGPSVDHTRGDEIGFFMYIAAGWATPRNAKARLISPEVPAQRQTSCLEFWYHMYGVDIEELSVYIQPSNEPLPTTANWIEAGDHGDAWKRATVNIELRNVPFKIVFQGKRGIHVRDDIAIDDVRLFKSSPCPPNPTDAVPPTTTPPPRGDISCTFEEDYCNYTQSFDDVFDWARHKGTASWRWYFDSITEDHTLGTSKGHYMMLQVMEWWFHQHNDNARMVSPLLRGSRYPRCLRFFYVQNGFYPDLLNIYIVRHGATLPFDPNLAIFGDSSIEWKVEYLDIPPTNYPIYVVFEGIINRVWWPTETAVDDITLAEGECPKGTSQPLPKGVDCDFEGVGDAAMCSFTHDEHTVWWWRRPTNFHWQLNSGPTSTNGTGPPSDHTFKNQSGHYLYMEASQPQRPGDIARIISPELSSRGQRMCIQFYYYMTGLDIGSLSVLWISQNFPEKQLLRVNKIASRWLSAYIDISDYVDSYQIAFEAVIGQGYRGDIAIDDIRFLPQPCTGFEPESKCGFDKGYEECYYRQDDKDLLEWILYDAKGIDASPLGNSSVGSFLYITSNSKAPKNTAVLRPPMISRRNMDHCLSFDVIVKDDPEANLTVAVEYSTGNWRNLMAVNASVASKWSHYNLTIPLDTILEDPFQIKLTSYFGEEQKNGIIAIDNVTIWQASCDVDKATTPSRQVSGGSSRANVALGTILALVLIGVAVMLVVAWYWIRRSSGSGDSPFAIKYKNKDENVNPVTLSGEPGIANPVYEKAGLENNA